MNAFLTSVILLVLQLTVSLSQAQMPPMGSQQRLSRLNKDLSLSKDQKAKVKPMLEGEDQQMKSTLGNSSLTEEEKRAKLQSIHKATMDQVREVLNSDQQKRLDQLEDRMRQRMGDR